MTEPAIAILPHGHRLGPALSSLPVSALIWPEGCPERLQGRTVGDLAATDHLIVYPRTDIHVRLRRGTRARISLILAEPAVIHARHHRMLRLSWRRFHRILTFNEDLLRHLPNAVLFPLGTTWVPEWRQLPLDKTAMCSLIASAKRHSDGHKLRHAMVEWARDTGQEIEVMGRGYTPFEAKAEGLAPFRYSIVIENTRETNYFSEKLLDAVLCNTVPIYWGCPNLDRFMVPEGIIQCQSAAELQAAVAAMSVADFEARLPQLRRLQGELEKYIDIDARAAKIIRQSL
ncbi:glycosyltransferase family 10 fucosyltransferase [Pseudodonghicola flavimaris]|uniref:Glycosyltransferase family 10 n=1 Tax=Pseudodonghicola flavimaris TaxID=3050036 RepID=A0ABT7EYW6_9RHOB|nr:glycosyltransferase family 10 [Pseudodonghicola flavimaris]MDK3017459.1 glycosyltransferase family 10 [Pseudodonghicola flavimaris]